MRKEVETLMTKVNKINFHNSFPLYHKSLPLYRKRSNRRKNILSRESGKISSKELDAETGFYYYGARYLDPRTSRWLSGDPALGEYLPGAPVNDDAKKSNQNLPGQGGVFNLVNLHVYHYAGNNPVKYVDPDGKELDVSQLDEGQRKTFQKAYDAIAKTDRGVEILGKLVFSQTKYKVTMNNEGKDEYDTDTKTISWDPSIALMTGDDSVITPIVALAHELGHGYQDDISLGRIRNTPLTDIENQNVKMNENPIAKERGDGIRQDYFDWKFEFRTSAIDSTNILEKTKTNDEFKARK
jgi:RHS repeat-associated protein